MKRLIIPFWYIILEPIVLLIYSIIITIFVILYNIIWIFLKGLFFIAWEGKKPKFDFKFNPYHLHERGDLIPSAFNGLKENSYYDNNSPKDIYYNSYFHYFWGISKEQETTYLKRQFTKTRKAL